MSQMKVPKSLDDVRAEYGNFPFPSFVFNRSRSALILFCAGFYGGHDCLKAADAGLTQVTGVDIDAQKLAVMAKLYPPEWIFSSRSVYDLNFDDADLVTVDAPMDQIGDIINQGWLDKWSKHARNHMVVNILREMPYFVPKDFRELGKIHRSEQVSWLILTRR